MWRTRLLSSSDCSVSRSASATSSAPRACSRPGRRRAGEEPLLLGRQQLVAPLDRRAQGALALGQVLAPPVRSGSRCSSRSRICVGRERLDARGGELERQRQLVEAPADLGDGLVGLEVRLDCPRPCEEEADAFLVSERRHRVLLLAGQVQRLPARDEDVEVGARGQQRPRARPLPRRRARSCRRAGASPCRRCARRDRSSTPTTCAAVARTSSGSRKRRRAGPTRRRPGSGRRRRRPPARARRVFPCRRARSA